MDLLLLHEDDDEVQQQTTTCQIIDVIATSLSSVSISFSVYLSRHTHHSIEMRSLHNNLRLLLISGNRSLHQKMMFRFHHHHQLLLLLSRQSLIKPLLFSTPSLLPSSLLHNNKWYSQRKDANDNDDHEIGVKARSTADEFARVAKEKVGSVSQSAEDAWEGTIEAVTETVEKGDVESVKNKHDKSAAAKRAKVEREK